MYTLFEQIEKNVPLVKTIPTANSNISSERWKKKIDIESSSKALLLGGLISCKTIIEFQKNVSQIG